MIGAAGECTNNVKDVFNQLLFVDEFRGPHSTGAALVKRWNDEILMHKAAMPGSMFVRTEEYHKLIDNFGIKVMIGHNRYATIGDKTAENAHPFEFDGLVGAHNGTLDNWALKRLDDWAKFGTDSEAMYNSINNIGVKETIGRLSGAWALTWFDRENNTINLLRNNKRPLYYAYSLDRTQLFWASEADMLEWILGRNHIKTFEESIFLCDPDKHYRWEVPEKVGAKFEKPVLAEVKERTFQSVRNFSHEDWQQDSNGYYTKRSDTTPTHVGTSYPVSVLGTPNNGLGTAQPKAAKATPQKLDTKKFRPPYKDALGRIINKEKFLDIVTNGCVFCDNANTVWGEFIYPLKDDMDGRKLYLCKECYEDDDTREMVENLL